MNNLEDDIIDVQPREEVMKGKTPRRLLWILGIAFILVLLIIAVFVVNGSDSDRKTKEDEARAKAAKEAAEQQQPVRTVEAQEREQTKDVLSKVKGTNAVPKEVQSELDKLRGAGVRSGAAPTEQTSTQNQQREGLDQLAEAKRLQKEKILSAPIFKSGKIENKDQTNAAEVKLLQRFSNMTEAQAQAQADAQMKEERLRSANPMLASANEGQAARSPAAGELEFNAAMEGKKLPSPTGLIAKSKNNCLITPGWIIPVANVEAMNSDLPGEIIAVVRENVYDSLTNTCLAIPKGSKILATYNPNVKVGQERFNIAASVLQLPNGKRVPMMGTTAYDLPGNAGVDAEVNNHFFKMLGTSFMLGLVGKLSGNDTVSTSSANGSTTTNTTIMGKVIGDTASTILERNKNITPTLTRPQATRFNFKVTREFYMEPYRD